MNKTECPRCGAWTHADCADPKHAARRARRDARKKLERAAARWAEAYRVGDPESRGAAPAHAEMMAQLNAETVRQIRAGTHGYSRWTDEQRRNLAAMYSGWERCNRRAFDLLTLALHLHGLRFQRKRRAKR